MSQTAIKGDTNMIDVFHWMHSSWLTWMHCISSKSCHSKPANSPFNYCFPIWYKFSLRKFKMSTKILLHFCDRITLEKLFNTKWTFHHQMVTDAFDNKISLTMHTMCLHVINSVTNHIIEETNVPGCSVSPCTSTSYYFLSNMSLCTSTSYYFLSNK